MTNETEAKPMTPAQAVDYLILALEKSGIQTTTEVGQEKGTMYVTARAKVRPTDGTVGQIVRYTIEATTGKITVIQVL